MVASTAWMDVSPISTKSLARTTSRDDAQSDDSLGHLCRQVGSAQAHMGLGGSVTLSSEISQLSIGLTFSLLHLGQTG